MPTVPPSVPMVPVNIHGQTFDALCLNENGKPRFRTWIGGAIRFNHRQGLHQHFTNPLSIFLNRERAFRSAAEEKRDGTLIVRDSVVRGFGLTIAQAVFRRLEMKQDVVLTGKSVQKINNTLKDMRNELNGAADRTAFDFIRDYNKGVHDYCERPESVQALLLRWSIREMMDAYVLPEFEDSNRHFIPDDVRYGFLQTWNRIEPQLNAMNLTQLKLFRDYQLSKLEKVAQRRIVTALYNVYDWAFVDAFLSDWGKLESRT